MYILDCITCLNALTYLVNPNYLYIHIYLLTLVCPHQGAPFHKGRVSDIEDMGGSQISCVLHNWAFSLEDGKSASNTFVVDVYNVKLMDGNQVYISLEPKNSQIEGQRRDFNGSELIYNPGLGWI